MKLIAKFTDVFGNLSYVTVQDGRASHALANGIPYALSSIAPDAMALKFDCEACETIEQLVATIARHAKTDKVKVEAHFPKGADPDKALMDFIRMVANLETTDEHIAGQDVPLGPPGVAVPVGVDPDWSDSNIEAMDSLIAKARALRDGKPVEAAKPDDLVIVLEGGLVSCVTGSGSMVGHTVHIIDYDTEGADDDELSEIGQEDGGVAEAYYRTETVDQMTITLPVEGR